eukprot:TRINITY_DN28726_c0_g1_i1.p1 TRINITY_DN28726_c0_g1~~TRINITY_DN28726_c0_g1_i1.p1  ORF type:complete len:309 (+),score=56.66 TRINITY_DN28726_c0_g1_i1:44-970(+)
MRSAVARIPFGALLNLVLWAVFVSFTYTEQPPTHNHQPGLHSCRGMVSLQHEAKGSDSGRVLLATRFWGTSEADFQNLVQLMRNAAQAGMHGALVAVHTDKDATDAAFRLDELREAATESGGMYVAMSPMSPWGGVSHSLNMLLHSVRHQCDGDVIVYVSPEVQASPSALRTLISSTDRKTLVAGLALPGHNVSAVGNSAELDGLTSPWNTCAAWQVEHLGLTGFLAQSDAEEPMGMEEPSTIALLQHLRPGLEVKLVVLNDTSEVQWLTKFDEERMRQHLRKMESKMLRTARQLGSLGLRGRVTVVR